MANPEATVHYYFCGFLQNKVSNIHRYFLVRFNKTTISLVLVRYEMVIANSSLRYAPR